ncbi:phosphoglycerate mutase-like protein [Mycena capillaripes]|nr:phosphoglycerate mutase-like protein [Mycena capillaripes]
MIRFADLIATLLVAHSVHAAAAVASSFAGATSTAVFPPPGATITSDASFFPDATQVNVFGPTPTGDEAFAIATAPVSPDYANVFPLVEPATSDQKNFDVIHSWGNLSPFQSTNLGLSSSSKIPAGCNLQQVHLLHRHGARYPTTGSPPASFAAALHAVASTGKLSASGPLAFLNTWTYKLGAEILTPFGRAQLFELGVGFRVKYGDLLKGFADLPVWRTTSEGIMCRRRQRGSLHFAAGFFGVQEYQNDYHQLIEIEAPGFNTTLAPYEQCANANNVIAAVGTNFTTQWATIYLADAQKRLAPHLEGLTLNATWLFAMQQTCAYETVALGYSAFCDLFTEEEWKGYEYSVDLSFWYNNGPGNPAIAAQGIGWVQELVSRLTQTRITEFASSVNGTIVSSNVTFPLSQPIFVDATHDTVISAIVVAMNFTSLAATGPLPGTHIPKDRSYIVNQISPFGSNMVGQVLSCPSSSSKSKLAVNDTAPTHIRWLLNDAVVPLTGIAGCGHSADGLCAFDTFVEGMQQRIAEVDFEFGCFGNYTVPSPDLIVDGQLPAHLRPKKS